MKHISAKKIVGMTGLAVLATLAMSTQIFADTTPTPRNEPIKPIAPAKVENQAMVDLGAKLWFDPRLSKSGFISCNSCHNLSMGGSDNLTTSIGHNWQEGPINSPTVLNSSLNVAQFWDGRAKDLQEQAGGPIANPKEMAFTHELAVDVLNSIPPYVAEFKRVFNQDGITIEQVTAAIAAFEETLVTPNSRFDQWLMGDDKALTDKELAGYEIFKSTGCVICHYGEGVGGSSFQKMGVMAEYQTDNPAQGVMEVTGLDADRFKFKVPTMRNIELTYPYFHDGAAKTMEEATLIMGRLQLGRDYTDEEVDKLVAFYRTLTGDQPKMMMPILPPSTNETPRPVPFK